MDIRDAATMSVEQNFIDQRNDFGVGLGDAFDFLFFDDFNVDVTQVVDQL
ncbi:MAG: hypothetical protein SCI25_15395 [Desulfuromonadales bacterium]|nr:hypothetical protein [Desulfuromonadales bacterium]